MTVYLPEEIGRWAKTAGLNLSRLLRDSITAERERRQIMSNTLGEPREFKLHLEDQETGRSYVGRITGATIARDEGQDVAVYLTTDDRVIPCAPVSARP